MSSFLGVSSSSQGPQSHISRVDSIDTAIPLQRESSEPSPFAGAGLSMSRAPHAMSAPLSATLPGYAHVGSLSGTGAYTPPASTAAGDKTSASRAPHRVCCNETIFRMFQFMIIFCRICFLPLWMMFLSACLPAVPSVRDVTLQCHHIDPPVLDDDSIMMLSTVIPVAWLYYRLLHLSSQLYKTRLYKLWKVCKHLLCILSQCTRLYIHVYRQ